MAGEATPGLRPDVYERLAATNPFAGRARRLFGRGEVISVDGNAADLRVGYDARGNALEMKQVPIISGYAPQVGDWVAIGYEAGHSGAPWVTGPSMSPDESEDPAGIGVVSVRSSEPADAPASTIYFDDSRRVWRGFNGDQWVDLSDTAHASDHNSLSGLQGGTAAERYHLTEEEYTGLWQHSLNAFSSVNIPIQGHRQGSETNAYASGLFAKHITDQDMADGFGAGVAFAIEDNAGVEHTIGRVGAVRAGADDTGDLAFWTASGGVLAERMRLTAAGYLGIGTDSPSRLLDVVSASSAVLAQVKTTDPATNAWAAFDVQARDGVDTRALIRVLNDHTGWSFGIDDDDRWKLGHCAGNDFTYVAMEVSGYAPTADIGFWGNVGIGTNDPDGRLHMQTEGANTNVVSRTYRDSASGGTYYLTYTARGTEASPSATVSGDYLWNSRIYGWDGSTWGEAVRIIARADGDWSGGNHGVYVDFDHTPNGSTSLDITMRLRNGQVQFKDGSAADPALTFYDESGKDTGLYRVSEGVLGVTANGANIAQFGSTYLLVNGYIKPGSYAGSWGTNRIWRPDTYSQIRISDYAGMAIGGYRKATGTYVEYWRFTTAWGTGDNANSVFEPRIDNESYLGRPGSYGWKLLYLSPSNTNLPSANGEVRAYGTANAFTWKMGDTVHYGVGRISTFHDPVRLTGANLDSDLASCTVDGKLRRQGRVIRVVAAGTGKVVKGNPNSPTFRVSLTFAGTTLAKYEHSPTTNNTYNYSWRLEALILCESNTVAHVRGRHEAGYKTGTADPWPGTFPLDGSGGEIVEEVWEDGDALSLGDGTDYSLAAHLYVNDGTTNAYGEVTHFLVEVL